MSDTIQPEDGSLAWQVDKLSPQPGDIIVVKSPRNWFWTPAERESFREAMTKRNPGVQFVCVPGCYEVDLFRFAGAATADSPIVVEPLQ